MVCGFIRCPLVDNNNKDDEERTASKKSGIKVRRKTLTAVQGNGAREQWWSQVNS